MKCLRPLVVFLRKGHIGNGITRSQPQETKTVEDIERYKLQQRSSIENG